MTPRPSTRPSFAASAKSMAISFWVLFSAGQRIFGRDARPVVRDVEQQEFSRKMRGYEVDEVRLFLKSVAEELERLHPRFLALADAKKEVYDDDLYALMADERDPAAHWAMGRALWLRGAHPGLEAAFDAAYRRKP